MKVVTVRQPFASLIAVGAKTLLDQARPTGRRGRLLIRSAAQSIPWDYDIGEWHVLGHRTAGGFPYIIERDVPLDRAREYALPLGMVVASCELVDCVPVLAYDAAKKADTADLPYPRVETIVGPSWNDDGELMVFHDVYGGADRYDGRLIINEAAFGDFAPGRWVWLLDDVRPTTERCPRCWSEARTIEPSRSGPGLFDGPCPTCRATPGHCAPVRMRGGPGLRTPEWGET